MLNVYLNMQEIVLVCFEEIVKITGSRSLKNRPNFTFVQTPKSMSTEANVP